MDRAPWAAALGIIASGVVLATACEDEPEPMAVAASANQIRTTSVQPGAPVPLGASPGGEPLDVQLGELRAAVLHAQSRLDATEGRLVATENAVEAATTGGVEAADVAALLKQDAEFVELARGPRGEQGEPGDAGQPGQGGGSACGEDLPDLDGDGDVDHQDCALLANTRVHDGTGALLGFYFNVTSVGGSDYTIRVRTLANVSMNYNVSDAGVYPDKPVGLARLHFTMTNCEGAPVGQATENQVWFKEEEVYVRNLGANCGGAGRSAWTMYRGCENEVQQGETMCPLRLVDDVSIVKHPQAPLRVLLPGQVP